MKYDLIIRWEICRFRRSKNQRNGLFSRKETKQFIIKLFLQGLGIVYAEKVHEDPEQVELGIRFNWEKKKKSKRKKNLKKEQLANL